MKTHYVIAALLATSSVPSLSAAADLGFYLGIEGGYSRTQIEYEDDDFYLTRGALIDAESDRKDRALGLYGGYTFSKHFAIELTYADLGETSYTTGRDFVFVAPFPVTVPSLSPGFNPRSPAPTGEAVYAVIAASPEVQRNSFETKAVSLSVLGRFEIGAGFSVIGRAGLAVHRTRSDLQVWLNGQPVRVVGGEDKESAGAGVIGLGVEWSFHPDWAVRLQAQQHLMIEEEETNLIDRGDVTLLTGGVEYRF